MLSVVKQNLIGLLASTLKLLAKATIWRYRPTIVGVTGNVGKTSTKLAIAAVLAGERRVRWSKGNLNNELGLPLAILGDWPEEKLHLISRAQASGERMPQKVLFWLEVIVFSLARLVYHSKEPYPEVLVLEYGADHPGDIKKLISIARPNITVLTAIGDVPVHVEFYGGPEDVAREKAHLIECLFTSGYAVLGYDDARVMALKDRTRGHIMTFGFAKGADLQVSNFENRVEDGHPAGIGYKLNYGGNMVPMSINGVLGRAHAYAGAAAAAVGVVFGMNLVKISEALSKYRPAHSRMEVLPGVKDTWILNDCYNASLLAMERALETLENLPGKRKIAVLGDMLEIGEYAIQAHEKVGVIVAKCADVLVAVGPHAKFIAESARKNGLTKKNIHTYNTAEEAARPAQSLLKKGDLVLVKASRAIGLDKVVEEIRYQSPESEKVS
ncbi:MAG: Mur ligase family protein [Candidatus Liptonbacteria bacterium]